MLLVAALVVLLTNIFKLANGALVYPTTIDPLTKEATNFTSANSYNLLLWKEDYYFENLVAVNLQANTSLFQWCDLSQFTKEGVIPILNYHGITQSNLDNGMRW